MSSALTEGEIAMVEMARREGSIQINPKLPCVLRLSDGEIISMRMVRLGRVLHVSDALADLVSP